MDELFPPKPQSLDVYFGHDSVHMPEGMRNPPSSATNLPCNWVLQGGLQDSLPGFHLAQHCQCYYPSSRGNVSATVSLMQYCKGIGM